MTENIKPGILTVIGIGPGDTVHLTPAASEALTNSDHIIGYGLYIDLLRPVLGNQKLSSGAMQKEVERVTLAVDAALSGERVALVSSGDAGVYAMAGLVFEICRAREISITMNDQVFQEGIGIRIIPGISALNAAASLLGAPLSHDFCTISLSDLLTPWETIETRLHAAGSADFVTVIYNPKSKKRDWQLKKSLSILGQYRSAETPIGMVRQAMREDQEICISTLKTFNDEAIDMKTVVIVGNRHSFIYEGAMVTPRGYGDKYIL
ncbi:precorrin-3B C(17)-methyltransferase [Desulfobacterales bacterium HSG17]|nr:precorrin-3B C(17)-methyltransferase [Desulfobacterales bacterium HSG17]